MGEWVQCNFCGKLTVNNVDPLYCLECGALLRAHGFQRIEYGDGVPSPDPAREPSPATACRTVDDVDQDLDRLRVSFNELLSSMRDLTQAELLRLRNRVSTLERSVRDLELGIKP